MNFKYKGGIQRSCSKNQEMYLGIRKHKIKAAEEEKKMFL